MCVSRCGGGGGGDGKPPHVTATLEAASGASRDTLLITATQGREYESSPQAYFPFFVIFPLNCSLFLKYFGVFVNKKVER